LASLAAVMVMLTSFWLTATLALLFGGELNAEAEGSGELRATSDPAGLVVRGVLLVHAGD
jgi:hypothetical protein